MRISLLASSALLALSLVLSAGTAAAIEIDPGTVGSEFNSASLGAVQASDVPGNELEITFADMKHLELAGDDLLYSFGLVESTGVLDGIGFEGYLTDELGQEIPNSAFAGTFLTSGWMNGNRGFEDPTVIHDVHFTFLSTPQFPFDAFFAIGIDSGTPRPVVGAWVPEPNSLVLLGLGIAVLGLRRRRVA